MEDGKEISKCKMVNTARKVNGRQEKERNLIQYGKEVNVLVRWEIKKVIGRLERKKVNGMWERQLEEIDGKG